jgi:hypothetical protein
MYIGFMTGLFLANQQSGTTTCFDCLKSEIILSELKQTNLERSAMLTRARWTSHAVGESAK